MTDPELPDHVVANRAFWTTEAAAYVEPGRRSWADPEPSWGIWGIRESEARILPDVAGLDTIELGCGTAYVSAWLARRGARPVGVDITPAQLETARLLQREHGLEFPLLEANAEAVPLPDASFDLAISEYGAAIWCDPYRWIPEAARLLRPGGRLIFLGNSTLLMLCSPDEEEPAGADRVARRRLGRVQPGPRRHDPAPPLQRLRGRGPGGAAGTRERDDPLSLRDPRVGPALAIRRGLDRAPARLSDSRTARAVSPTIT
jgi:SAM-dependent methyltransferase